MAINIALLRSEDSSLNFQTGYGQIVCADSLSQTLFAGFGRSKSSQQFFCRRVSVNLN